MRLRKTARNVADQGDFGSRLEEFDRKRDRDERDERRRHDARDALRQEEYDCERCQPEGEHHRLGMGDQRREAGCRLDRAVRNRVAEQGIELQQDDDHADAGHEPGDHRCGHVIDVASHAQQPERDLQQAAEHHHGKRDRGPFRRIVWKHRQVLREHRGHHHGHRAGGPRHLRRRAAEQRGEEADEDRAVDARNRTGARGDAEGHCQRQRNHGRSQAAGNVTVEVAEVKPVKELHKSPTGHSGIRTRILVLYGAPHNPPQSSPRWRGAVLRVV